MQIQQAIILLIFINLFNIFINGLNAFEIKDQIIKIKGSYAFESYNGSNITRPSGGTGGGNGDGKGGEGGPGDGSDHAPPADGSDRAPPGSDHQPGASPGKEGSDDEDDGNDDGDEDNGANGFNNFIKVTLSLIFVLIL